MRNKTISPEGDEWGELREILLIPEERAENDLKITLLGEIIKARQEKGFSQKKLEEISGVRQAIIARLERGTIDPQLSTVIKLLVPLGKTLAIVPMEHRE